MPISNPSLRTVPDGLQVDEPTLDPSGLLLPVRTTAALGVCPACGQSSSRVHSRYWRTLQDLPWQDRAVTWRVEVRRFRCSHCPGRAFTDLLRQDEMLVVRRCRGRQHGMISHGRSAAQAVSVRAGSDAATRLARRGRSTWRASASGDRLLDRR